MNNYENGFVLLCSFSVPVIYPKLFLYLPRILWHIFNQNIYFTFSLER
jgi:hypothetical protein